MKTTELIDLLKDDSCLTKIYVRGYQPGLVFNITGIDRRKTSGHGTETFILVDWIDPAHEDSKNETLPKNRNRK